MDLNAQLAESLKGLLTELSVGPPGRTAYVLNPGDRGLLESLSTRLWRENPRHRLEALCSHAAALRQRLLVAFTATRGALDQRLALASRTLDGHSNSGRI